MTKQNRSQEKKQTNWKNIFWYQAFNEKANEKNNELLRENHTNFILPTLNKLKINNIHELLADLDKFVLLFKEWILNEIIQKKQFVQWINFAKPHLEADAFSNKAHINDRIHVLNLAIKKAINNLKEYYRRAVFIVGFLRANKNVLNHAKIEGGKLVSPDSIIDTLITRCVNDVIDAMNGVRSDSDDVISPMNRQALMENLIKPLREKYRNRLYQLAKMLKDATSNSIPRFMKKVCEIVHPPITDVSNECFWAQLTNKGHGLSEYG